MQGQQLRKRPGWRLRLWRFLALNIRGKIVLPYLILTLLVMVIGTYVVTSLAVSSLDERLNNHLQEAGRVVSDRLTRREAGHRDSARIVAFTQGLPEALHASDQDAAAALARPAAAGQGIECLILTDANGQEMLHLLQRADGSLEAVTGQIDTSGLWMVQTLLAAGDPDAMPQSGFGIHEVNQRTYYFTAIPVDLEGEIVGVVIVGTSLDTLLVDFHDTSLAEVTVYLNGGRDVATSFAFAEEPADVAVLLDQLAITPQFYEDILHSEGITILEDVDISVRRRWYRLAHGPLVVGNARLGVFSAALPSQFVVRAGTTSRNTYLPLFAAAMVAVFVIGYLIAERITRPLSQLVRTSQAVAEGDLEQRTGIKSTDEIGVLAETFDGMTGHLAERTQALEETLGRLRAILSSIGDGVLLEDIEGNFVPLNVAARAMLEEMSTDFLLSPLRELSLEESDQSLDAQPSSWLVEHRRFEAGGRVISAHSAAVRTDEGEYLGTVIVLRDVTAEVEAERLKDAFVAHVSHELRTPLTAIKGYGSLLLATVGSVLNEEQRGFLETINRHTDNLVMMINELLDFSEMEAGGRLALQRQTVSLSDFAEGIAEEWQPQMDEKELAFRLETSDDLPMVDVDTGRLRWAVINLVRNAWQCTPTGGEVTLRLSARNDQVVLDVIDTGAGLSPEGQRQLFSRFYRRADDDSVRGLGLGLYVTKAIVEAHGGEIRIASEEGVGSTFSVVLPTS